MKNCIYRNLLTICFLQISFCCLGSIASKDIRERLKWINPEALTLAIADMHHQPGFDATTAEANLKYITQHLDEVKRQIEGPDSIAAFPLAETLIRKQRSILLSNPLLDMDRIAVTRFTLGNEARQVWASAMCMPQTNYMGLMDVPRLGYNAEICELSHLRDDIIQKRTILKPQHGEGLADPQLHWDADRMLFAMPTPVLIASSDLPLYSWRIFEIGLDGKGLKLVSDIPEPDLEYADPCYLPGGRILFTTNIGYNGIPCEHGRRTIHNLALYNPADSSLRKISFDQDGNWSPTVLNNGRLMYTRWEYTDLTHYFSRIVMHSNPDGTETKALYGSGSYWPNSIYDMKQLPQAGSKFVGIVTGHHGVPRSGRLIIFDPAKGRKEDKGVVQEIPFRNRKVVPEIKDRLVDDVWPQFTRPYPLNNSYFLVAAKPHKDALWGIYLVDVFDNMTLITESEGDGYISPIPVKKRPIPPVIPDRIKPGDKEATVFIQDLYMGEGLQKVPKGTVKKLRVFTYEYAYLESPSDHDAQGIQSGWDIKRELGTVDVEEDGSAIFKVPSNTPISLQPLDEQGAAIQWMRSWFTAMPGEVVSCIGCHEDQNTLPIPKRVIASQKKALPIHPPKDGIRPFTFENEIQPILDRYCVSCHDGTNPLANYKGNDTKAYDRTGIYQMHRTFKTSYLNLHPYLYRQGPEADMYVLRPYEYHASNSELIQLLEKGHHQVTLSESDKQTLFKWIDFNVPYFGSFEIAGRYKGGYYQYPRRRELMQKYGNVSVDWRKEIKDYARLLKSQGPVQPLAVQAKKEEKANPEKTNYWCFDATAAKELQQKSAAGPIEREIEIAPGVSMRFSWIPPGQYMKGTDCGQQAPVDYQKKSIKAGFWMGTIEVSNAQYGALFPAHDSRYIGQQWKDHTTPGYPANKPEQPVIRVSWEEAQDYCTALSKKTGLNITLPTEEEWEWACRAGSGTDMWYGTVSSDYSAYENMADAKISDLAVIGIDPFPMPKNYYMREFWDFVPRDTTSNDGSLISVAGGKYKPNPWGLYDMHGNVAEWTCSDSEAEKEKAGDKIVCGGSWRDRASKSTAFYRRYYKPWQAPYNVGFRLIVRP